ncbi:MAG: HesA/MoeB/ThiF family protein, partial [Taibaiella sp.]|nr:HesA/MoeB/ThiF family protein [Taibaiella sp.]
MPYYSKYSCQMALPGFGLQGQELIAQAKVLIVGAGGLGCPAAQYLAATGVGTIAIADNDTVSNSNLHRQPLYTPEDIGSKKAVVACRQIQSQNPDIETVVFDLMITAENAMEVLGGYDIVLDCTDNFETKYLLNDACVILGKPLVSGAIYQYEGQVAVLNVLRADSTKSANYRDIYPDVDASKVPNCVQGGVIPSIAGIIGCMMANETIKYLTKAGDILTDKLLVFNALTMRSITVEITPQHNRPVATLTQMVATPTVTLEELHNRNKEYELIDVRTAEEHNEYNIGGVNVPLNELAGKFSNNGSRKAVVFYCASGRGSAEAVKLM